MTFDELKEKAHRLPQLPGVYLMHNKDGTVIYVGKAKSLRNRVSQYFGSRTTIWKRFAVWLVMLTTLTI